MPTLFISPLLFLVALLYASVGHGGASGYLAILSFYHTTPAQMATSALLLNLLVSGIAWTTQRRSGHFSLRFALPFLAGSIPFAFIGGSLHIAPSTYDWILSASLFWAALRLASVNGDQHSQPVTSPSLPIALVTGAGLGLISGIVGIGGGIFLSPLLLFVNWATPKQTAATSAFFILVNSIAGLLGRASSQAFDATLVLPFVLPALLGGWMGTRLGSSFYSAKMFRRALALVLLLASLKGILL